MSIRSLSVYQAHALVCRALQAQRCSAGNAAMVADALVAAEVDGQAGHGLSRVASYCAQSASGKVDGGARPQVVERVAAGVRIDAANGFAYPALRLAETELAGMAGNTGIAAASVFRSHHFGQAGYHVERLARLGLVGIAFGNSPRAIAPWGGREGVFGTNPIAFAAPRASGAPLVIDLSLSKVARGKVMVAARKGEPIPQGWALDARGRPTTDAQAALEGTMLPMGDAKGAALVMMVEILAAALSGARFGYEASSFFTADGDPPGVGQFLVAIDPRPFSGGGFASRLDALVDTVLAQQGVRLPGSRRVEARARAEAQGLQLDTALLEEIEALARG
jgi:(2R)-3-sulfolactate dehydrogenase (NADP+)